METVTTPNADGTYDIVQSGHVATRPGPADLQRMYWDEVRASTLGLVSFSRDAIRLFGIWPRLIAFEPGGEAQRKIVGGIFARHPYGWVVWAAHGDEVSVAVERFAPRLPPRLFRLELWFHHRVWRRLLLRVNRAAD